MSSGRSERVDHQEIFPTVQLVISNVLEISIAKIERGSKLEGLGCDDRIKEQILYLLHERHGIRLNRESGMAQMTVQGLCNYVVCQLLPERQSVPTEPKRKSVCHWVF